MSLWGFDGEDSSLTSWPSLSQFDDMVWNEFGEPHGDHVVPDPSSPSQQQQPPAWPRSSEDRRKRAHREGSVSGSAAKGEPAGKSGLGADVVADVSDEEGSNEVLVVLPDATTSLAAAFADGGWTGLGGVEVDELPVESELFVGSDPPPVSQDTLDDLEAGDEVAINNNDRRSMSAGGGGGGEVAGDGGGRLYSCAENSAMAATPHFSISDDLGSRGDDGGLEMFGNESSVASKGDDGLLELSAWENIGTLDDMDKLFRNSDTSFDPVIGKGSEGLDWPSPSSPPAVDRGMPFVRALDPSPRGESVSVKMEADAAVAEDKELAFGDSLPALVMQGLDDVVADNGSPRSLSVSAGAPEHRPEQQHSLPCADRREMSCEAKPSDRSDKVEVKGGTAMSGCSLPNSENTNMPQAYRARRQAANRKRSEERFKRSTAYRKLSPGPPFNADARQLLPLPRRLPGQPPHLQTSSAFPLQCLPPNMSPGSVTAAQYPPILPYVPGGYALPLVPAMSSCPSPSMMHIQHPQPMYVDLPPPGSQVQRQPVLLQQPSPLASGVPFETGNRPPSSSPNMTPQEKMEKLRWRQQMQARMAVEQQQQQLLASQTGEEMGTAMYHMQPQPAMGQGSLPNQPLTPSSGQLVKSPMEVGQTLVVPKRESLSASDGKEEGDCSLEGSVLCQLRSTVSSLDLGTRLCIRDALFRLARSSMKRRAAGSDSLAGSQGSEEQDSDANAVESSTASGPQSSRHSRATSVSMVETETNSIDRSIANLLFSKPPPTMYGLQPSFCA